MLRAIVTTSPTSGQIQVALAETGIVAAEEEGGEGADCVRIDQDDRPASGEECPELNPIAPEVKEIVWGFGSFVVLAVVLRYVIFPKFRAGMTARAESIRGDFEKAETVTASARAEVAEYEAQVASVRADAQGRVEAARATLEAERAEQLAEVNARIAEKRAAANAEVEAAKEAVRSQVSDAVADVTARASELATGRPPSRDAVSAAVDAAMGANA